MDEGLGRLFRLKAEANGMDTSYLRAALERSVCSQHFDDEPDEDFEEDNDFQMKF